MQIKLSPEEIYGYELKCHQAIAVCDFGFKTFVIQDFSDRTMSLKVEFYYTILAFNDLVMLILAKLLQFCVSLWQELLW